MLEHRGVAFPGLTFLLRGADTVRKPVVSRTESNETWNNVLLAMRRCMTLAVNWAEAKARAVQAEDDLAGALP